MLVSHNTLLLLITLLFLCCCCFALSFLFFFVWLTENSSYVSYYFSSRIVCEERPTYMDVNNGELRPSAPAKKTPATPTSTSTLQLRFSCVIIGEETILTFWKKFFIKASVLFGRGSDVNYWGNLSFKHKVFS